MTQRKGALVTLKRCKPSLGRVHSLWCDSGCVGRPLVQDAQAVVNGLLGGHVAAQIAKTKQLHPLQGYAQALDRLSAASHALRKNRRL